MILIVIISIIVVFRRFRLCNIIVMIVIIIIIRFLYVFLVSNRSASPCSSSSRWLCLLLFVSIRLLKWGVNDA